MKQALITIFLLFGINVINTVMTSYVTEKPSYMKSCTMKDPGFDQCSTEAMQMLFAELSKNKGLPDVKNLLPIDPLTVSKISVRQKGTSAINLNVELKNIKIFGLSKIKVTESKFYPKDFTRDTKIFVPKMKIAGDYKMDGKILLINLNGHGNLTIVVDNLNAVVHAYSKLYEKDDLTFFNITNIKTDYTISNLRCRLENLFNGNTELEESTNQFFNENWQLLSESLQPLLQKAISDVILAYFPTIFHAIPAKFIITDILTSKELYGN